MSQLSQMSTATAGNTKDDPAIANKRLHIKSLLISGFRSIREAEITNFSSKTNVVVGLNGAGKSNLFKALEFVLGEGEFENMSHEKRKEQLHEGASGGNEVLTAFVEVTFDNSEGRLPLDSEEVVLRRSVGLKKDEFFLNRKHVSKSDIANLLESAGFSRSNPYYICRQGKVTQLCIMKDSERLTLLKEVAGTTVYDKRRKDSEMLLEEAQQKTVKIEESIHTISTRLDELQQEKEELEQFRDLDRERRALDYLLNDGELIDAERGLEALEQERSLAVDEADQKSQELEKISDEVEACDASASFAQQEVARLESERKKAESQLNTISKLRTRRELDVRDVDERVKSRTEKLVASRAELSQIEEQIEKVQEELDRAEGAEQDQDGLRRRLDRARAKLATSHAEIKRLEQREEELRAKQGRTTKFGNDVEARDAHLNLEIAAMKTAIAAKNSTSQEFQAQVASMKTEKTNMGASLENLTKMVEENEDGIARAEASWNKCREARDASSGKRKELWRAAHQFEDSGREAAEELKRASKVMRETVPPAVASGLDALDEICDARGVPRSKVFGPLSALIRCEQAVYRIAVEVAAGNQLLHVVVEDDATAAELMEGLLEKRCGRLTFKPLNVLIQREKANRQGKGGDDDEDDEAGGAGSDQNAINLLIAALAKDPEINADDAVPLITKVACDEKYAVALRCALGKTLLCRNHRIASACSKKYRVNCVTLDGDQVSRQGALSGGYHDTRKSRLAASEDMGKAKLALDEALGKCEEVKISARREDQEVTRLAGELDKFETSRQHMLNTKASLAQERTRTTRALRAAEERLAKLDESSGSFSKPDELLHRVAELEKEKLLPPQPALLQEERDELASLPAAIEKLRAEDEALAKAENELKLRVVTLKSELEEHLLRRRDELLALIEQDASGSSSSGNAGPSGVTSSQEDAAGVVGMSTSELNLERFKQELESAKMEEAEAKTVVDGLDTKLDHRREELNQLTTRLIRLRERELVASEGLDRAQDDVEKILDRRSVLLRSREQAAKKIRELGSLPAVELDKHRALAPKQLAIKIAKVNSSLKKFSTVNKKALDQFVTFSEQKEALVQRHKEARDADLKIRELITHLDREKDEAILLTFKQVARNFREIFSELVPDGIAELRMVKGRAGMDGDEDADDFDEVDEMIENTQNRKKRGTPKRGAAQTGVDSFVGVSPRVSFSGSKETVPMQQLSGGQKSLVALTLIFAIQRCDPAPFYLFDEIDQALDTNHRAAVAALIQKQTKSKSRNAQFIITTFRPELVQIADKSFGVQFSQKMSSVAPIKRDQALKFIKTVGAMKPSSNVPEATETAEYQAAQALLAATNNDMEEESREEIAHDENRGSALDKSVEDDESSKKQKRTSTGRKRKSRIIDEEDDE